MAGWVLEAAMWGEVGWSGPHYPVERGVGRQGRHGGEAIGTLEIQTIHPVSGGMEIYVFWTRGKMGGSWIPTNGIECDPRVPGEAAHLGGRRGGAWLPIEIRTRRVAGRRGSGPVERAPGRLAWPCGWVSFDLFDVKKRQS